MKRQDEGLAELLRYENIADFSDGKVRILDRRVYPAQVEYVVCSDYRQVAKAITDMVTQSYGPFHAAAMGMALAAWQCRTLPQKQQLEYLDQAADTLASARPTTARKMRLITDRSVLAATKAILAGESACDAIRADALCYWNERYARIARIGGFLADRVRDGDAIMTQCYADCDLGMLLRALSEQGKKARFFTPETRPYLQGARLTASVIHDMGFPVTLITDNMPAWTMREQGIDLFTCAADVITVDGHVVNKVGTLQIAICAKYFGVPVYVTGNPNSVHPTAEGIVIEQRDKREVLSAMGVPTAKPGVDAYYPAFDLTPPELISGGVVTDRGILPATRLNEYFSMDSGEGPSFS